MKRIFKVLLIINVFIFSQISIQSQNEQINSREKALKYYTEKYHPFHKYSKGLMFDFSSSETLTDDELKYLVFFPEITYIAIGSRHITDKALEYLQDKNEISGIDLSNTSVTGEGFKYLTSLKKIHLISIEDSPFTDQGLKYISEIDFPGEVELSFSGTLVTDEGIKYISKLKLKGGLYLNETKVTDGCLKYFVNQKGLKMISFVKTKVTKKGAEWLMKQLPDADIWYGDESPNL